MKIFFDTEFIEDGETILPLSIGMVREDGQTYYAEFELSEEDRANANDWVRDNVFPYLDGESKPNDVIAQEIINFVGADPEFWAYYASYDWVLLCQLYGTMMQLPNTWPMYCNDLKQLMKMNKLDRDQFGDPVQEHDALSDAAWVKDCYDQITSVAFHGHARRFVLNRLEDETGISGTGVVAWGVLFPDGKVVTRWCVSEVRQTCTWDSISHVYEIHGHNGKTRIDWIDE